MKSLNDIKNKRILYAATKNSDYIRLVQEIRLLRENGNTVTVLASPSKRYINRLIYVYRRLIMVKMKDYDISFIGFAPQLIVPFFGWKLKKKPLVIDFFISFYDTICFDRKKVRSNSIIGRILKYIDKRTLYASDLVVCDTKMHGKYFCEEFGFSPKKMKVLYLEADKSIYYPRENKTNKDFTVLYFGSILPLQGVSVILEAINLLKDEKGLRFVIIGPLGKSNVRTGEKITEYIEWLPQDKLADKIATADLCLAGHFNGSIMKARRTIAGKTYIYRAMGKPVILGDNPANHELFSENDEGVYFCEMGNSKRLAELIKSIKDQICR